MWEVEPSVGKESVCSVGAAAGDPALSMPPGVSRVSGGENG